MRQNRKVLRNKTKYFIWKEIRKNPVKRPMIMWKKPSHKATMKAKI